MSHKSLDDLRYLIEDRLLQRMGEVLAKSYAGRKRRDPGYAFEMTYTGEIAMATTNMLNWNEMDCSEQDEKEGRLPRFRLRH